MLSLSTNKGLDNMDMKRNKTFNSLCAHHMLTDANSASSGDLHCGVNRFNNDSLTSATKASVVECLMGVITKRRRTVYSSDISHRRIEGLVEKLHTAESDCIRSPLRENHCMLNTATTLMRDEEGYSDITSINSLESSSSKVCTPNMFVPHLGVVGLPPQEEKIADDDTTFSVCAALSETSAILDSAGALVECAGRDPCTNECRSRSKNSILYVEEAEKSPDTSLYGSDNVVHRTGQKPIGFICQCGKQLCEHLQMPFCHSSASCSVGKNVCKSGTNFKTTISSSKDYNAMQAVQSTDAVDYGKACIGNGLEDDQESIVSVCVSAPTTVNQSISTVQKRDTVTGKHIQRYGADETEEKTPNWISTQRAALGQLRAELAKNQLHKPQPIHFAASKCLPSGERGNKEGNITSSQTKTLHRSKYVDYKYETPSRGDNHADGSTLPHSMDFSTEMVTLSPPKDAKTGTVRASPHNFSSISHISVDGAIHDAPSVIVECLDPFLDDNAVFYEGVQESNVLSACDSPVDFLGAILDSRHRRVNTDGDCWKRVLVSSDQTSNLHAFPPRLPHVPSTTDTLSRGLQTSRYEKLQREQDQRNMAECTFHPTLSPGSKAIIQASTAAAQRSSNKCSSVMEEEKGPQMSVYERLYPAHLSAEAAIRRQSEEEAVHRHEIEKELFVLRQRCGASYNPKPLRHQAYRPHSGRHERFESFAGFLSNVLQSRLVSSPSSDSLKADNHVSFVESTYRSPMAVAMEEEETSRSQCSVSVMGTRSYQNGDFSSSSMIDKYFSGEDTICQPHRPCDATTKRFTAFMDRQNMHHLRRERTVSTLAKEMTPHFTPQTTRKSTRLLQDMINRSVLHNSAGSDTSDWIQHCRANHIPVGRALVSKHLSSYVDPCSFSPKVSSAAHGRNRRGCSRESESSRSRKATFQRLYESHHHLLQAREVARRRAEEEKVG